MADIHVEKRNAVWPWILGLAVLALLIWAFVGGRDDRATTTTTQTTPTTTVTPARDTTATTTAAGTTAWNDDTRTTDTTLSGTAGTTADTTTASATALGTGNALPVSDIVEQPEQFNQQVVSGTARVVEVESERALWVEQNGERLLVLIDHQAAQSTAATQGGATAQTQAAPAAGQPGGTAAQPAIGQFQAGQAVQLTGIVHDSRNVSEVAADANATEIAADQQVLLVVQSDDIQTTDARTAGADSDW